MIIPAASNSLVAAAKFCWASVSWRRRSSLSVQSCPRTKLSTAGMGRRRLVCTSPSCGGTSPASRAVLLLSSLLFLPTFPRAEETMTSCSRTSSSWRAMMAHLEDVQTYDATSLATLDLSFETIVFEEPVPGNLVSRVPFGLTFSDRNQYF